MVLEYFQKNSQAMQQISGPIFEDKADFILEIAKVTDGKIDTETLYQVADEKRANKKSASTEALEKKPASKKSTAKKSTAKKSTAKKSTAKKLTAKKSSVRS